MVGFAERLLAADVSDSPARKRGVGGQFWTDGSIYGGLVPGDRSAVGCE